MDQAVNGSNHLSIIPFSACSLVFTSKFIMLIRHNNALIIISWQALLSEITSPDCRVGRTIKTFWRCSFCSIMIVLNSDKVIFELVHFVIMSLSNAKMFGNKKTCCLGFVFQIYFVSLFRRNNKLSLIIVW